MRVLMFGWEFPPHISGGLGTACFGMTQALAKKGAEIIFVLPRVEGSAGQNGFLRMRGASGTPVSPQVAEIMAAAGQDVWARSIRCLPVESPLVPYLTPQGYAEALEYLRQSPQCTVTNRLVGHQPGSPAESISGNEPVTFELHGGYGPDLMTEVHRYSRLAAAIAVQEQFDVIHVHDWMTYPAGMLARALTGKPLVAHIHATEYDRSGLNINEQVAGIERAGLNAAVTGIYDDCFLLCQNKPPDRKVLLLGYSENQAA